MLHKGRLRSLGDLLVKGGALVDPPPDQRRLGNGERRLAFGRHMIFMIGRKQDPPHDFTFGGAPRDKDGSVIPSFLNAFRRIQCELTPLLIRIVTADAPTVENGLDKIGIDPCVFGRSQADDPALRRRTQAQHTSECLGHVARQISGAVCQHATQVPADRHEAAQYNKYADINAVDGRSRLAFKQADAVGYKGKDRYPDPQTLVPEERVCFVTGGHFQIKAGKDRCDGPRSARQQEQLDRGGKMSEAGFAGKHFQQDGQKEQSNRKMHNHRMEATDEQGCVRRIGRVDKNPKEQAEPNDSKRSDPPIRGFFHWGMICSTADLFYRMSAQPVRLTGIPEKRSKTWSGSSETSIVTGTEVCIR